MANNGCTLSISLNFSFGVRALFSISIVDLHTTNAFLICEFSKSFVSLGTFHNFL